MIIDSVKFRGHRCFKKKWVGFEKIKPVNIIIGRNNTGKSHLLDLAESLSKQTLDNKNWQYHCSGVLDQESLRNAFNSQVFGGDLYGNHWTDNGVQFKDARITWEISSGEINNLAFPKAFTIVPPIKDNDTRLNKISKILKNAKYPGLNPRFKKLFADRDIRTESAVGELKLYSDGRGATNIIRRYIVSSSSSLPRELIQQDLLKALNTIFAEDGNFSEIQVQLHDDSEAGYPEDHWEVFLGQQKKGLVSLSRSGSGLKTVILVLLNLLVVPEIEKAAKREYTFAFEELENNLHPALLRRLLRFIEKYATDEGALIFLTTHSSVALDIFSLSENACITHVQHDGESADVRSVSAYFDQLGVVSELGAKPSDLLQANGIIWVEGPSDCIYLNRWIDLFSGGQLAEGRDYQCAFYGGSLLARTQFQPPEQAEKELVNLFRINPNIVVICDGDRSGQNAPMKNRVKRINREVRAIPGAHIWITKAREIENYIPGVVLGKVFKRTELKDPDKFEAFFPRQGKVKNVSYIEKVLNRKGIDKMELAVQAVPHMSLDMLRNRFELDDQIQMIVAKIKSWAT